MLGTFGQDIRIVHAYGLLAERRDMVDSCRHQECPSSTLDLFGLNRQ